MTSQPEDRVAAERATDLSLLGVGGLGLVRLLLSIAAFAVTWAVAIRGDGDGGDSSTLALWRLITARGVALADVGTALVLLTLARNARDRTGMVLAIVAAAGFGVAAVASAQGVGDLAPGVVLIGSVAPVPLGIWLVREAVRIRRGGLLAAAVLLVAVSLMQLVLPFVAGAMTSNDASFYTVIRLTTAWNVGKRVQLGLIAAIPLVLVLRRRAARRQAEPVRELPEDTWREVERALGAIRQALVTKALIVAVMLAWAGVIGDLPAFARPEMMAATAAALAVASATTLWGARRWLQSPARSPAVWAFAAAAAVTLAAELAMSWLAAHAAGDGPHDGALQHLGVAVVVMVAANGAAGLLLVLSLHRLAAWLGVPRPARTLARIGLLGVLALLIPWTAWLSRGLDLLLDPWALSAVLVAGVGLGADLVVLFLVMDDLERRVQRGREAAVMAARFS